MCRAKVPYVELGVGLPQLGHKSPISEEVTQVACQQRPVWLPHPNHIPWIIPRPHQDAAAAAASTSWLLLLRRRPLKQGTQCAFQYFQQRQIQPNNVPCFFHECLWHIWFLQRQSNNPTSVPVLPKELLHLIASNTGSLLRSSLSITRPSFKLQMGHLQQIGKPEREFTLLKRWAGKGVSHNQYLLSCVQIWCLETIQALNPVDARLILVSCDTVFFVYLKKKKWSAPHQQCWNTQSAAAVFVCLFNATNLLFP